jgi:hypothetical protein
MARGGANRDEVYQVVKKLAVSVFGKANETLINEKVDSAFNHQKKRNRPIVEDVRDFIESSSGVFLSSEVVRCLQESPLSSMSPDVVRGVSKNVSKILNKFCEQEFIQRDGNRNGQWRRVEKDCMDIDFMSAVSKTIDIKYPFGIEDYVLCMPKNIIIIAGETNSGKTAFMLNVVEKNMHKHDIHYFSSEMGDMEFRSRLQKFDTPLDRWKFKAYERSDNFADVIKPNDINIIDYLEISDNFYQVGGKIRAIFDKLENGIAIIAIQKKKGADYAHGGSFNAEKARLYISMSCGEVKLTKAKNWAQDNVNPNNMTKKFKLVQGCKFIDDPYWVEQTGE